jgi:hypothetical protein
MTTKVHFVRKSRVDNAAVKRGDAYYWWKLPFGEKTVSATYPSRSQLTNSDYLGCVFDLEDSLRDINIEDEGDFSDMLEEISEAATDIREQCQENLDNMAPNLHVAPNGRLLIARLKVINEVLTELDDLDFEECAESFDGESHHPEYIEPVLKKMEVTRVGKVIKLYGE